MTSEPERTSSSEPIVPAALRGAEPDHWSYIESLKEGNTSSIWSLWFSEWEIRQQVAQYDTLPVTQSLRGIAALMTAGAMALTVILVLFGVVASDAVYGLVIYLPIAFFIYRGHRWAMVLMMIFWTIEKGYSFYTRFPAGITAILFWIIFTKYYFGAFQVEQARRRSPPAYPPPSPGPQ